MDTASTGVSVISSYVDLHGAVERSGRRHLAQIVDLGLGIGVESVIEALSIGVETNDIASVNMAGTLSALARARGKNQALGLIRLNDLEL